MIKIMMTAYLLVNGGWMPIGEFFQNEALAPYEHESMELCADAAKIFLSTKPDSVLLEAMVVCDLQEDGVSTFHVEHRETK